jgi:basic membrane protein A
MICNSPLPDGGWYSNCYDAMVAVAEKNGWEHDFTANVQQTDFAARFREYASMGFTIVFAPGNQYGEAIKEVAADFPDTYFIVLNSDISGDNYESLRPDTQQIGWLAGILAALQTKTNKIGFVSGLDLPTTKSKLDNYIAAAKKINPEIEAFDALAGSYEDVAKGKEIADNMVKVQDADVIFGDAGMVEAGVRESLANFTDRWQIGQPSDIAGEYPDIQICNVVTDNQRLLELAIEDIFNGTFGNKIIDGNVENGVLYPGAFGNAVSDEVKTKYNEYVEEIKSGTFKP